MASLAQLSLGPLSWKCAPPLIELLDLNLNLSGHLFPFLVRKLAFRILERRASCDRRLSFHPFWVLVRSSLPWAFAAAGSLAPEARSCATTARAPSRSPQPTPPGGPASCRVHNLRPDLCPAPGYSPVEPPLLSSNRPPRPQRLAKARGPGSLRLWFVVLSAPLAPLAPLVPLALLAVGLSCPSCLSLPLFLLTASFMTPWSSLFFGRSSLRSCIMVRGRGGRGGG